MFILFQKENHEILLQSFFLFAKLSTASEINRLLVVVRVSVFPFVHIVSRRRRVIRPPFVDLKLRVWRLIDGGHKSQRREEAERADVL